MKFRVGRLVVVLAAATLALVAAPQALLRSGLRVNGSPSMPLGLYRLRSGAFPRKRGEIVFACPNASAAAYLRRWDPSSADGSCPGDVKPLVKIAAALPGDRVTVRPDGVHVNGGPALARSAPQRTARANGGVHAIPAIPYGTYTVPRGTVWLYAPEWYSYDSRYYGALPVIGVGMPLLVHRVEN